MNTIDIIVLIPIVYFGVMGFRNGFVRELFGVAGIVLSIFLTFYYMHSLAEIIVSYGLVNAEFAPYISGIIIFIGTLATVQLIAWVIKKFLEKVYLSTANRILGSIFGILKSSIIISALLLLLSGLKLPSEDLRKESISYPYLVQVAPLAYNTAALMYPGTEDFAKTIKGTIKEYNPIN